MYTSKRSLIRNSCEQLSENKMDREFSTWCPKVQHGMPKIAEWKEERWQNVMVLSTSHGLQGQPLSLHPVGPRDHTESLPTQPPHQSRKATVFTWESWLGSNGEMEVGVWWKQNQMLVWLTGSRKSKWNLNISWREIPDWGFLARLEYFENSFYSYNPEKKQNKTVIWLRLPKPVGT